MSKVVESAYHTVDETISAVERLLSEGRVTGDVIIVTSDENYSDIQNRTLVEVDKVSADGDMNIWEKFKDMFADVGQDKALEHYGIDKQTALRYNDVLKSGNYVVLVEEMKDIPIRQNLEDGPKELGKSSTEQKKNEVNNERGQIENPLQGKPKDTTEYRTEDIHETAVEDSEDLPRFSGNSITGQPFVDPLQDKESE
ncbi:general stress protein [Carnobacterium funditum]|uniref:general stress protein n=1 Tax=Carnobacterium funditum TaxID=2752 RepID=UPI00068E8003|nr:general stress protein [Carnobacterium funditum]